VSLGDEILLGGLPLLVGDVGARLGGGVDDVDGVFGQFFGAAKFLLAVEVELLGAEGERVGDHELGGVKFGVCIESLFGPDDGVFEIAFLLVGEGADVERGGLEVGIGKFGDKLLGGGDAGIGIGRLEDGLDGVELFLALGLRGLGVGGLREGEGSGQRGNEDGVNEGTRHIERFLTERNHGAWRGCNCAASWASSAWAALRAASLAPSTARAAW